jgi:hypothetical protein
MHSFEGNHAIHACSDVLLMESRDRRKSQDREGTLLVIINDRETKKIKKCQEALHLLTTDRFLTDQLMHLTMPQKINVLSRLCSRDV